MNQQNPFKQLLSEDLSDEAAYSLWECLRELTMICEEKYYPQISREYALRIMRDEHCFDDALPGKDDRQMEMPF